MAARVFLREDSKVANRVVRGLETGARYGRDAFLQKSDKHEDASDVVHNPLSGVPSERPPVSFEGGSQSSRLSDAETDIKASDPSSGSSERNFESVKSDTIVSGGSEMMALSDSELFQHMRRMIDSGLINFDTYHKHKEHLQRFGMSKSALKNIVQNCPLCIEHFRHIIVDLKTYNMIPLAMFNIVKNRNLHMDPYEKLDISAQKYLTEDDMIEISKTDSIHTIKLVDCDLTDRMLLPLAAIPNLRILNLARNRSLRLSSLPRISSHLQLLNLSDCDLTNASIDYVKRAKQITTLDISKNARLTHECIAPLTELLLLKHLSVEQCEGMRDGVFESLRELHHMKTVDLRGCSQLTPTLVDAYQRHLSRIYTDRKWRTLF